MKKSILLSIVLYLVVTFQIMAQTKASDKQTESVTVNTENQVKADVKKVSIPCHMSNDKVIIHGTGDKNMNPASTHAENGFPVFVNTGNHEQDMENYRIAKDLWIEQNPELYEAMQSSSQTKEK